MGALASECSARDALRRASPVLLADVDRFKQYNDTHGISGGRGAREDRRVFRKTTRQVDCVRATAAECCG